MDMEATLKAGDVCFDCKEMGLKKYLRYFKINLNGDILLKCESNECMYPYNHEMSSSDEDESIVENVTKTNSQEFIDDLIKQCKNENINNDLQNNENLTGQVTQFDVTFLDDLNEMENKNQSQSEISEETDTFFDNKVKIKVDESKHFSFLTTNEQNGNNILSLNLAVTLSDSDRKIDIQSIETLPNNNLHTSSTTFDIPTDVEFKSSNSSDGTTPKCTKPLSNMTTFISSNSTSLKVSGFKNKSLTNLDLSDMPKANIMKGNALLRKLAEFNDQPATTSRIFKSIRTKKITKSNEIKNQEKPIPALSSSLDYYSLDKVSEILLANRMKNDSKE